MYKYLFGPVPSRRLGMSLGVDLVPKKVCSLDCVYCEVGKTTKLTLERKEYIPFEKIISELQDYFYSGNPDPDFFTFSGSGEPTLNSRIGDVIKFIKEKKPSVPIAVLTNGTLLSDKKVREELYSADIVLPSLDAATRLSFEKINRPAPAIEIEDYIQGLINFSKEYSGKIFLEVFLLPGYNMAEEDISALREAIIKINPDKIQLNSLDRPGTVKNIRAATHDELIEFKKNLNLPQVEIVSSAAQRKEMVSYRSDVENVILETIQRRPCTLEDLSRILGLHVNEINKYLDVLESDKRIEVINQDRGFFYQIADK